MSRTIHVSDARLTILERIVDLAERVVNEAVGVQEQFDSETYEIPADLFLGFYEALGELIEAEADQAPAVAKCSLADALQIGGWFYFVGQIRGYTATFPWEGEQYIYVPKTEDNLEDEPVIPHNDVWIPAGWFAGDWYGPIAPPVTKERKALSDGH